MHLLVLSAFRLGWEGPGDALLMRVSMHLLVLSAFRLEHAFLEEAAVRVSMHLLVLSAFRHAKDKDWRNKVKSQCTFWCSVLSDVENWWSAFVNRVSQCTFWCSVLSDGKKMNFRKLARVMMSQCTFWCSVLSDMWSTRPLVSGVRSLNAPSGAQCFPTGELP